jgi:hypothetical protein
MNQIFSLTPPIHRVIWSPGLAGKFKTELIPPVIGRMELR